MGIQSFHSPFSFFPPDIHVAVFCGDLRAAIARRLLPDVPSVVASDVVLDANFDDDREQSHVIAAREFSKFIANGSGGATFACEGSLSGM